jgi:hypothetical protein
MVSSIFRTLSVFAAFLIIPAIPAIFNLLRLWDQISILAFYHTMLSLIEFECVIYHIICCSNVKHVAVVQGMWIQGYLGPKRKLPIGIAGKA